MDFLVQQGYPDAAARFAEEANIETGAENALMDERVKIRNAIYQGNLQMAIEEINEIDTQVCPFSFTTQLFDKMTLVFMHHS